MLRPWMVLFAIAVALSGTLPRSAQAQNPWHAMGEFFRQTGKASHRKKPPIVPAEPAVEVADQLDWLEHEFEKYGSVVAKQPNVWGESRLTRHRQEYEAVLQERLGKFDATLQGALRRSDQASLALAFALNQASEGATASAAALAAPYNDESIKRNDSDSNIDLKNFAVKTISIEPTIHNEQLSRYLNHLNELRRINEGDDTADAPGYALNLVRIPVSVLPGAHTQSGYGAEITMTAHSYLSDELLPTTFRSLVINDVVDQLALPITKLIEDEKTRESLRGFIQQADEINLATNQIDRISAIIASGSLNTSVQRKLTGELWAIRAETIKRLNDEIKKEKNEKIREYLVGVLDLLEGRATPVNAVDLSPAEAQQQAQNVASKVSAKSQKWKAAYEFATTPADAPPVDTKDKVDVTDLAKGLREDLSATETILKSILRNLYSGLSAIASPEVARAAGPRGRRSLLSIPPAHVDEMFGTSGNLLGHVALEAYTTLADRDQIHVLDVENYLRVELEAAYEFLRDQEARLLMDHCTPQLVQAIRTRRRRLEVATPTRARNDDVEAGYHREGRKEPYGLNAMRADTDLPFPRVFRRFGRSFELDIRPSVIDFRNRYLGDVKRRYPRVTYSSTATLGWALIVESALLNQRLMEDMREAAIEKGGTVFVPPNAWLDCYLPTPSPMANEAFKQYVQCRWPIQVFALDPVTQDQNIADIFSRRREMQLAISVAVARGNMSANSAMRFARRLETDIETIQLNRTAVSFSHGANTFGWRFYPRFQSPPTPSNLGAFAESLFGGPSQHKDLNARKLEPGARDCVAIVLMPSFVPYATFETRANWFKLTNPAVKEFTSRQIIELSSAHASVAAQTHHLTQAGCLRPVDAARFYQTLNILEQRLPYQSMQVQIPYENTLGGFELFNTGVTDLAPELRGFYGAKGAVAGKHECKDDGVSLVSDDGKQCTGTCGGTTLFLVGDNFSVHDTKVVAGGKCVPFWLMSRQIMRVTIPPVENTVTRKVGTKEISGIAVHVASPYGVSNRLFIPAVAGKDAKKAEAAKPKEDAKAVNSVDPKLALAVPKEPLGATITRDAVTNAIDFSFHQTPALPAAFKISAANFPFLPPKAGVLVVRLKAAKKDDDKAAVNFETSKGPAAALDAPPINLKYDPKTRSLSVPFHDQLGAGLDELIARTVEANPPAKGVSSLQLTATAYARFDNYPVVKLTNDIVIDVKEQEQRPKLTRLPPVTNTYRDHSVRKVELRR